ncbi:hypothetical protein PT974_08576 [Cladobotryum mycophilum]|uniref:RING-type E3 ubiquitin transferase n=1 Tax=Cladobotryum mycophilum TaxID=491253 RepID=A0ABR0SDV1_9HYPO
MASRQGGPSSFTPGDAARDAEPASNAELSARVSDENTWTTHERCQWQTADYYDQECHRFFDCPSHFVARRLSIEEPRGLNEPGESLTVTSHLHEVDSPERGRYYYTRTVTTITTACDQDGNDQQSGIQPLLSDSSHPNLFYNKPYPFPQTAPSNSSGATDWNRSQAFSNRELMGSTTPGDSGRSSPRRSALEQGFAGLSVNGVRIAGEGSSRHSPAEALESDDVESTEVVLPRWQPDAEVTYCPICQAQFSIFVRKHHCRFVVINTPEVETFIVRPPGSEVPLPQGLLVDGLNGGFLGVNGLSGGERVRLCNPCVPDPNTAPPQSPTSPLSPRSARHRSRSSLGGLGGTSGYIPPTNRYGGVFTTGQSNDPYQFYASRSRSITMDPAAQRPGPATRRRTTTNYQSSLDQLLAVGPSSLSSATLNHGARRRLMADASSSRQRALPPRPPIAEEDECPICHLELPSRSLPNYENLREVHITDCIQSHSAYGSPRTGPTGNTPPAAPRRTGMYTYAATEKDCVDDAECTICLEEFTVGVPMARLECLCRFHRACISAWFVNHPGRCPVHQHDGFGY